MIIEDRNISPFPLMPINKGEEFQPFDSYISELFSLQVPFQPALIRKRKELVMELRWQDMLPDRCRFVTVPKYVKISFESLKKPTIMW